MEDERKTGRERELIASVKAEQEEMFHQHEVGLFGEEEMTWSRPSTNDRKTGPSGVDGVGWGVRAIYLLRLGRLL